MKEPSPARKRTDALHARAIKFATDVNQLYPNEEMNYPSRIVWEQLVRAADSTSNNLIEAGNGSSDADFLNKLRLALREAKESRACLTKIRLAPLQNAQGVIERGLEQEADELCAIFATIIINMELRIAEERDRNERRRRRYPPRVCISRCGSRFSAFNGINGERSRTSSRFSAPRSVRACQTPVINSRRP
jgi:four helix bundle protein